MVQVWYLDVAEDPKTDCHCNPPQFVGVERIEELGILYRYIPKENADSGLKKVCRERGYTFRDELFIGSDRLRGFEEKAASWFTEHIHNDEEVRYIAGGSGYFDVRDKEDRWIRIYATEGDLIALPAGIYHRYTVDSNDFTNALRFYTGEDPKWAAYYRRDPETDKMDVRQEYLKKFIRN